MLINLRRSHSEYIKKFNSRPNLFFIGERLFHREFLPAIWNNSEVNVKTDPELRVPTFYGCAVVRVNDDSFGYGFFEYDDLYKHRLVKSDLRTFVVEKREGNHMPAYSSCGSYPTEASLPKLLEIPTCVIEEFNNAQFVAEAINRMHSSYWEYLGLVSYRD
ncbi:hypothetical protein [Acinetobacter nosocomialis]|uniref:hypothetical protein n=1 Tax=Acinetobacter nosocomialis TaxID=106654 RepID=UPI0021CD4EED|nr:hypothetical protein [Acinetobacter nosocomialis]MCU4453301.1 hypothetical protein [Acinetobacter nosocomialis]MCU4586198.1 hypothetical protein [Acinetobacter nosocomialis]